MPLSYFRFSRAVLDAFIGEGVSRNAMLIYAFLNLNCDHRTGRTHAFSYAELGEAIGVHRTTAMRACAELEEAGLIVHRPRKNDSVVYEMPHVSSTQQVATEATAKRQQRDREKAYQKAKHQVEDTVNRRLTQSETSRMRQKFGL